MRLTDEQVMQDNKRFANCNALAELKYCGWDIPHRKSITNDEIHFYAWLCRSAVALLKEQEDALEQMRLDNTDLRNCNVELLKEQEWNLLTEDDEGIIHGLPGDDGQYLMTDGRDIWIDDYMDGVDDGIFLDSGRDVREIKAWMSMPKPYKGE